MWIGTVSALVDVYFRLFNEANSRTDDAETYDGAPVGIQLVGRRLQEEKMLTLAGYIGGEIAQDVQHKA